MKYLTVLIQMTLVASIAKTSISDTFENIMFLHHSTGGNLISQGGVRSLIADYNTQHGTHLELWDHGYNYQGVHDQNNTAYSSYNVPSDNTNPDGYYALFNQPLHDPPDNAFSRFMLPHTMGSRTITHEVFIFKSCFPASDITSEAMLQQYKDWYLAIRNIMDAHPEKIFIPFTPPPLVRTATTPANADRARRFAEWLSSSEYLSGHPNIYVFNFWWLLAEHDSSSIYYNCLKQAYGGSGSDSHPNQLANQTIAPLFVNHIVSAIASYRLYQDIDDSNQHIAPNDFIIAVNYPNPFNSTTTIAFQLPQASNANLFIYDMLGRKVQAIDLGFKSAGTHQIMWDATEYSSGVYFYDLTAAGARKTGRMILLK